MEFYTLWQKHKKSNFTEKYPFYFLNPYLVPYKTSTSLPLLYSTNLTTRIEVVKLQKLKTPGLYLKILI